MGQERRETNLAAGLIDRGGLHRGNLMLAEALADDIKAAGERSVVEGPVSLAEGWRADGGGQTSSFRMAMSFMTRLVIDTLGTPEAALA